MISYDHIHICCLYNPFLMGMVFYLGSTTDAAENHQLSLIVKFPLGRRA